MPLAAIESTIPPEDQLGDQVRSQPLPEQLSWCAHSLRAPDHPMNQDCCLVLGVDDQSPTPGVLRTTLAQAVQPRKLVSLWDGLEMLRGWPSYLRQ